MRRLLTSTAFWVVFGYGAFVGLGTWMFSVSSQASSASAQARSVRAAEIGSTYEACVRSIPQLEAVNRFVGGVQLMHRTLLHNAAVMHAVTEPGSDVYRAQAQNLARLRAAAKAVAGVRFPVPSVKSCAAARARTLGRR